MATTGSVPPVLEEGDLHRLVDGLLDRQRQNEVVLRLKGRAAEAAQVAAWREQNDLLKAAFAEVEHDPVPATLRLTPLRLRCIGDERPGEMAEPALLGSVPQRGDGNLARLVVAAGLCLIAAALGSSWLVLDRAPPAKPAAVLFAGGRDADGLLTTPAFDGSGSVKSAMGGVPPPVEDLPTSTIPDLGPIGFAFTGAALRQAEARAIVFSYQDRAAARLSLSVSHSSGETSAQAIPAGAVAWQRGGRLFVLNGEAERLPAAAAFLQASAASAR